MGAIRRRRRALLVAATLLAVGACGGGGGDGAGSTDPEVADDLAVLTTDEAAVTATADDRSVPTPDDVRDVASIDRRPTILAELGGPDAFMITVDEVAGELSRFESWSYLEAGSQIDLVDGEVLWDVPLDDLPSGSLLPLAFSPMEFEMLASVDETLAALDGVELAAIDVEDADLDVDGAEFWAGEQLALGFVDDALVYVEAFPLAGSAPEEGR